jgi:hypothetical protein
MSLNHVQEHIDLIAKYEQDFLAQRTTTERVGDRIANFAGSLPFVGVHLLLFFSGSSGTHSLLHRLTTLIRSLSPFLEPLSLLKRSCWRASSSRDRPALVGGRTNETTSCSRFCF